MEHYYENVPGLGNVAVSRHAQERLRDQGITQDTFEKVLWKGRSIPDGPQVVNKELNDVRIVILMHPEPFRGAVLVKTAFRLKAKEAVR